MSADRECLDYRIPLLADAEFAGSQACKEIDLSADECSIVVQPATTSEVLQLGVCNTVQAVKKRDFVAARSAMKACLGQFSTWDEKLEAVKTVAVLAHKSWIEPPEWMLTWANACIADNYPRLLLGTFYVLSAWDLMEDCSHRGTACKATYRHSWGFLQRLMHAEQWLIPITQPEYDDGSNGDDSAITGVEDITSPLAWTLLLYTACGLSIDRVNTIYRWRAATAVEGVFYQPHRLMIQYLSPKWHGDAMGEDLLEFIRLVVNEQQEQCPDYDSLYLLLVEAHCELFTYAEANERYFILKEVREDVCKAYHKLAKICEDKNQRYQVPSVQWVRDCKCFLAFAMWKCRQYSIAHRALLKLQPDWIGQPFSYCDARSQDVWRAAQWDCAFSKWICCWRLGRSCETLLLANGFSAHDREQYLASAPFTQRVRRPCEALTYYLCNTRAGTRVILCSGVISAVMVCCIVFAMLYCWPKWSVYNND